MGSYQPSLECFMVDVESEHERTPEGHVQDASDDWATPPLADVDDGIGYHTPTPKPGWEDSPELRMSQIGARQ